MNPPKELIELREALILARKTQEDWRATISTLQLENRQHLEAIKRNETRIGKLRDLIRDTHQNQELVLEQRFLDYLDRQIAKYREGDEQ